MIKTRTYLDIEKIKNNETIKTDICIVGGGAAGITLALEFCDQNFKVLIVESGEKKFTHRNQHLSSSKDIGIPSGSLMFSQRRQFGGTTVKWAGRCRPLDEIDFLQKKWIPYSGWPYQKKDLDPYYERSLKVFKLDELNYSIFAEEPDGWFEDLSKRSDFTSKTFLVSSAINFALVYGPKIEKSSNIQIMLKANVTNINLDPSGEEVNSLTCRSVHGKSFFVTSAVYILAAGAIESTRLLLSSDQVHKNGVGNQNDLVGRFYMDHAHFGSGAFVDPVKKLNIRKENIQTFGKNAQRSPLYLALGLKEEYLLNNKMTNASGLLVHRNWNKIQDVYYSSVGVAFQSIYDILRHYIYPDIKFLIKNIILLLKHIPDLFQYLINILISFMKKDTWVGIHSQFEQVPNPESRIKLSSTKNEIGQANIIIDWKLNSQDIDNLKRYHVEMKANLEKMGLAINLFPIDYDDNGYPKRLIPGKHHMGTTRMNNNPKLGVVDENCKIHGISNLFISSSSVFPTSGQANPTMTIVALAIKLADHIKINFFERK